MECCIEVSIGSRSFADSFLLVDGLYTVYQPLERAKAIMRPHNVGYVRGKSASQAVEAEVELEYQMLTFFRRYTGMSQL